MNQLQLILSEVRVLGQSCCAPPGVAPASGADARLRRCGPKPALARAPHLVRPSPEPGDNPYHFVIVHVDGDRISFEVQSVDWGTGYAPYRSNRAVLRESLPRTARASDG